MSSLNQDTDSADPPTSIGAREIHQRNSPSLARHVPHNLPADLSHFIGRGPEIAEVTRLLPATRLLTLAGSAGVGKTRLALRVAGDVVDQYRNGVWLVELATVADPLLVPKTVAHALGVAEQPGRSVRAALVDALRPKHLLLILDNCEHLVQACADLVEALLRACPDLRVLTTSRQSLHVAGETIWRVPSMTLPPPESRLSDDVVAHYDATRLFVARAQAALPSFTPSDQNGAAIAQICARLDGIPLAIELAAARVAALGLVQIAERLNDRFRILTGGSRGGVPRQQTLRAALDWSIGLLSEPEYLLFRRLAVFVGGWTLEGAEAVCAGEGLAGEAVLDLLAELVDKSLVVADETSGSVRYRLLETMRQHGGEKLRAADEEVPIRDRHRTWYADLADEGEPHLRGSEQATWLARLECEHDNLRATLAWCLDGDRDPTNALRLAGALAWFWRLRGHLSEGRRWLDLALARRPATSDAFRVRALNGAGFLAFAQNDLAVAARLFEDGLRLAREGNDQSAVAWALHGLGRVAHGQGDFELAVSVLNESLATFRSRADIAGSAYALYFLANVARDRGDYARAAAQYAMALDAAREVGDTWSIAWTLIHMGTLTLLQGRIEEAAQLYREGLILSNQIRALWGVSDCLWGLARIATAHGQWERAARLFGADQVLVAQLGTRAARDGSATDGGSGAGVVRSTLGAPRFDELVAEGRTMALEQAISYAGVAVAAPVQSGQAIKTRLTISAARPLTSREREVTILIARGLSNRQIAAALVITPRTVDTHVKNIFSKLERHSRAQVAAWAVEHGFLTSMVSR